MSLSTRSSRPALQARRTPATITASLIVTAIAIVFVFAAGAQPAAQAAFGVQETAFEAGTCTTSTCTYASIVEHPGEAFTQAAGHPPVGLTAFEFNHRSSGLGQEPEGAVKSVRVDLPPGLAGNPQALPKCSLAAFAKDECKPETQVGTNELVVFDGVNDVTISGTVYNLEAPPGIALDFGIHVAVEPLTSTHIYLEGHVAWQGDYHEYFEIGNIPREGEVLGTKVPLAVLRSQADIQRPRRRGRLPHAAQHVLEHHHLIPGSAVLGRAGGAHADAHTGGGHGLRSGALRTDRRSETRNGTVRRARWRERRSEGAPARGR